MKNLFLGFVCVFLWVTSVNAQYNYQPPLVPVQSQPVVQQIVQQPQPMTQQFVPQSTAPQLLVPPTTEGWTNGWRETFIHEYKPIKELPYQQYEQPQQYVPQAQYYNPNTQCYQRPVQYCPQTQYYQPQVQYCPQQYYQQPQYYRNIFGGYSQY